MKCDMKTMIKAAFGLAVVIVAVYATFPSTREWIITSAPFLLFLLCPLVMSMQSCHKEQKTKVDPTNTTPATALFDHTADARRSSFRP